jgi:hypothetical protein
LLFSVVGPECFPQKNAIGLAITHKTNATHCENKNNNCIKEIFLPIVSNNEIIYKEITTRIFHVAQKISHGYIDLFII